MSKSNKVKIISNKQKVEKVEKAVKLKDIVPVRKTTKVTIKGRPVYAIAFERQANGKMYTREHVEHLIAMEQKKLSGHPIKFMPSLKLKRDYRSMKSFSVDTNNIKIDLYGAESDEVEEFIIYAWNTSPKKGGNSNTKNDCLFIALLKALNLECIKETWNTPAKFKKRLGLQRNDMVPMEKITDIEKALRININITGEHTYTSSNRWQRTANISLENEHYTYKCLKTNELIKSTSYKSQILVMYYYSDAETITMYDGKNMKEINQREFFNLKHEVFGENAYVEAESIETLKEEHEEYLRKCSALKTETKGLIDYSTSGYSHKQAVLKLFHNKSKGIQDPEPLSELETEWLLQTFKGGLIFGEKCELRNAHAYDSNSAYSSIMRKSCFRFPVKQGDFTKITEFGDIIPYGIYRCVIEQNTDYKMNRMFKFNHFNKYTHSDIKIARSLNLTVNLIIDDEANALIYGAGKCVQGSVLFKPVIDFLYDLKLKKVPFAKNMLSALWGGLCEKSRIVKVTYDETIDLPDGTEPTDIRPRINGIYVSYAKNNKHFKLNYARLGPFLTSAVRKMMIDVILPRIDHVFRVHTDSMLCDSPQNDIILSSDIGMFKLENPSPFCIVRNAMSVEYFDIDGKVVKK